MYGGGGERRIAVGGRFWPIAGHLAAGVRASGKFTSVVHNGGAHRCFASRSIKVRGVHGPTCVRQNRYGSLLTGVRAIPVSAWMREAVQLPARCRVHNTTSALTSTPLDRRSSIARLPSAIAPRSRQGSTSRGPRSRTAFCTPDSCVGGAAAMPRADPGR